MEVPHQVLGLGASGVDLEARWKAHVLGQVILVQLGLRGGRHGPQAEAAVLHLRHVLLEEHHVVHVLLAGHVDAKVSRHVGLVVADLAPPRWFALQLGGRGGPARPGHVGGGLRGVVVGRVVAAGLGDGRHRHHPPWGVAEHLLLRGGDGAAVLQRLHVVQVLVGLHVDAQVPLGGGGIVADLKSQHMFPSVAADSKKIV